MTGRESSTISPADQRPITLDSDALEALPDFSLEEDGDGGVELQMQETIGQGGMGLIRRALQVPLGRDVAVKSVRPDRQSPEATLALLREAWVTGSLEHPNIVPVHALGRDHERAPLLVMKRIEGVAWCDIIRGIGDDPRKSATPDVLGRDLEILLAVCTAMEFAHSRGIVHRDLKPENVMVGSFGEVYVLDWGLAVTTLDSPGFRVPRAVDVKGVAGTPSYIAPEMVLCQADKIGPWSDVYLLGAILHEILTGDGRNHGESLAEVLLSARDAPSYDYDEDVPAELAAIANKACAKNTEDRYPNARAFHRALTKFVHHRHSLEIAATARLRLETLLGLIRQPRDEDLEQDDRDDAEVRRLLAECLFGFQLALRDWPENTGAAVGLRTARVEVAKFELSRQRPELAAALLADVKEPDPDLVEAIELARADEAARLQKLKELRRLEANVDLTTGMRTRAFISLCLAAFYGGLSLFAGIATHNGWYAWSHGHNSLVAVAFVLSGGAFTYWARDTMFRTEMNRRFSASMFAAGGAQVVFAACGWWLAIDPTKVMILELVVWCFYFMLMAATTDRRLNASAFVYILAAWGAATNLEAAWWFVAIGHFGAPMMAAVVWRPKKDYVDARERHATLLGEAPPPAPDEPKKPENPTE